MERLEYYGDTLTSGAGADLFDQIKTATGKTEIVAKQITMISSSAFTFRTNGNAWANSLYLDTDSRYKMSLTDVAISSIVTVEGSISIFIAILFW